MKAKQLVAIIFLLLGMYNTNAQNEKPKVLVNHQAIYVVDLKKSADFYRDIIGLEQTDEPFKIGKHAWFKTGPKTTLHIILGADVKKEYFLNNHICFTVSDFDAFINKLKQNNISWANAAGKKGEIQNRVDGVKQIWIQDPDNYWIEINNDPVMFDD